MNKKIYGFDKFFEKKLDLTDLKSDKSRGDMLVKKLKDSEDITLDSGTDIKIDKMKDPDIDGAWVDPAIGVENIVDDSGEFDIVKATNYFKNTKPKELRKNKLRANTYVPVLKDVGGKEYTLTDFKKDNSFGSTGAGIRIREHESIQMLFLAARLNGLKFSKPTIETFRGKKRYSYPKVAEILKTFVNKKDFKFGNVDIEPAPGFLLTEDMFKHYCADQSWLSTFSNVPDKLVNQIDSKGSKVLSPNMAYTIFHVSNKNSDSIPNVIFNKFKILSKIRTNESTVDNALDNKYFSRLPNPADAPKYVQPFDRASKEEIEFSKYCPADIYIVETNSISDLIKGINSCGDILELNTYLNDSFNDRQIIPVSLKRVGPSPNSATIIINAEEGMALPTFDVDCFRISSDVNKGIGSKIMTNSEWKNKGKTITRQRNLTMDSPNTRKNSNIDGEIDGVWARHGKVSLLWIKKFIEGSDFYQKLHDHVDMKIMEWQELEKLNIDQLKEMLRKVQKDIDTLKSDMSIEIKYDLAGKDIGGIEKKLISKIQSLQVVRALGVIDKFDEEDKEVDSIVSKMLLYALSIQNPGFSSPKYIRVI